MEHMQAKLIRRRPSRETRFAFFALLLAAAGLSILSGCRNPLNRSRDEPAMGTFVLTIGDRDMSRTIAPEWPGAGVRFDLVFSATGHEDVSRPNWTQGTTVPLLSGVDWNLTVTAYPTDPEDGDVNLAIARYVSSQPIRLSPGVPLDYNITLTPITGPEAPPGVFSWAIGVPGSAQVIGAHLLVTPVTAIAPGGEGDTGHDAPVELYSGSQQLLLRPGTYSVVFTLYVDGRENAVMREVLRIYSNMTSHFTETLTDLHFPTTLLNVILGAWSNYNAPGSIRAYLLYRGLQAGHFGLLDPAITGLGVLDGFAPAEFPAFLDWFDTLSRTGSGSGSGPIPYDLPSLARLVDAALVAHLTDRGRHYSNRNDAETRIGDLVANASEISFSWRDNRNVTVNVAGFVVEINFTNEVYDHRVRFDVNAVPVGGLVTPPPKLAYIGQVVTLPDAPGNRSGYTFTGWNTQANGGGQLRLAGAQFTVTRDITLYATWIPAVAESLLFPVTLYAGTGTGGVITLANLPGGTQIILPPPPAGFARENHDFAGWKLGGNDPLLFAGSLFTTLAGPNVLHAEWRLRDVATESTPEFTITLRSGTGVGDDIEMSVLAGIPVTLPGADFTGFTKQWHDLVGWGTHDLLATIIVNAPMTLDAQWYRPVYSVSFNRNPGGIYAPLERNVYRGTVITLPVISRDGHMFVGWNTQADGEGIHLGHAPFLVEGSITLYAEWGMPGATTFQVTFYPNHGVRIEYTPPETSASPFMPPPVPFGTTVMLPGGGFSRDNHGFIGWYLGHVGGSLLLGNTPFIVFEDVALHAAWTDEIPDGQAPPQMAVVTFHSNYGEGESFALAPVPLGTQITLPGAGFSRVGHVLRGWARSPDASDRDYILGQTDFAVNASDDLYAVWWPVEVTGMTLSNDSPTNSAIRGGTVVFTVSVIGTGSPPADINWDVTVSPEGSDFGFTPGFDPGNPGTATLTLNVGLTQPPGSVITVRATSHLTPSQFRESSVTVLPPTVTTVTLSPASPTVIRGREQQFGIADVAGVGNPSSTAVAPNSWEVVGVSGTVLATGTGITPGGLLRVAQDQAPGTLTVRARSVYAPTAPGNEVGSVTVTVPAPVVTDIVIDGYPDVQVGRGESHTFTATVTGQGFPVTTYTWASPNWLSEGSTFNVNTGELVLAKTQTPGRFLLRATSVAPPQMQATIEVFVPNYTATAISIDPVSVSITRSAEGETVRFTASVTGDWYPPQTFTWRIAGGTTDELHDSTFISEHGVPDMPWAGALVVPGAETNDTVRVVATSTVNPSLTVYADVNLSGAIIAGDWELVAIGLDHVMAITWDGQLYAWGANANNQGGMLGDGTTIGRTSPTRVNSPASLTGERWVSVSGGWGHTLGLRDDGSLWAWGWNANGRTGLDTTSGNTLVPTRVGTHSDWVYISASHSHSFAIRKGGYLYAWGQNLHNRLGISGGDRHVPTRVVTAGGWTHVSSSQVHTVGLRDGFMYVWGTPPAGANNASQHGPGTTSATPRRLQVADGTDDPRQWRTVAVGNNFTIGITDIPGEETGHMYAWGSNANGALTGTGTGNNATPTPIGDGRRWRSVHLNNTAHVIAIDAERNLWAWGRNEHGQVANGLFGIGAGDHVRTPHLVEVPGRSNRWISSSAGGGFSLAVQSDGSLWAWGDNRWGQLGIGDTPDAREVNPVRVYRVTP